MPFSSRKRILATGGDPLFRMQQPDSTVISEPSSKEKSTLSSNASSVMSSSNFVPVDSKELPKIRRSSVISVDSDHSDSVIDMKPLHSKDSGTMYLENETICDSPSTHSLKKTSFNFSKKSITDMDNSDLLFSPKKTETVVQSKSNIYAEDIEPDDFYIDDFDIDDFNNSDIPEYFDEPPPSSLSRQNSSTVTTTVKEGGPSKSLWEKKPTTPVPSPKPSNICSPGTSAMRGNIWSCI